MQLSRKILAGALIALLPLGSALACTTGAWTTTTGAPKADDPDASAGSNAPETGHVKRYSGSCGLAPVTAAASHVTNDTPGTEGVYRARVYFFNGITSGAPRFLEATSADAGGGTSIFSVTYDRAAGAGGSLTFTANGTTVPAIPLPAANRWYSVEVLHQTGAPLQVWVHGANSAPADSAALTAVSAGNVAGTVGSARLGNLNSAALGFAATPAANNTSGFSVDEFDSTRSAATMIGRLCRGDANNNANAAVGDNDLSALDAGAIVAEALGTAVAAGQPDANEDGRVTALDAGAVIAMRLANKKCN
jgi:hypothetical protein